MRWFLSDSPATMHSRSKMPICSGKRDNVALIYIMEIHVHQKNISMESFMGVIGLCNILYNKMRVAIHFYIPYV